MILSRGRNYLFLHAPPKTGGGTALSLALENRAMKDDILLGDTPPKAVRRRGGRVKGGVNSAGRLWKHSMLTDLYGLITPEEVDKLFIFTLVRNPPWDRMVSYYHWLQTQTFDHPAVALAKALDFADFIAHPQTLAAMRFAPPYGRYVRDREGGANAATCSCVWNRWMRTWLRWKTTWLSHRPAATHQCLPTQPRLSRLL